MLCFIFSLPEKLTACECKWEKASSLVFFVFPGHKICSTFSVREVHNTNSVVGGTINSERLAQTDGCHCWS